MLLFTCGHQPMKKNSHLLLIIIKVGIVFVELIEVRQIYLIIIVLIFASDAPKKERDKECIYLMYAPHVFTLLKLIILKFYVLLIIQNINLS